MAATVVVAATVAATVVVVVGSRVSTVGLVTAIVVDGGLETCWLSEELQPVNATRANTAVDIAHLECRILSTTAVE